MALREGEDSRGGIFTVEHELVFHHMDLVVKLMSGGLVLRCEHLAYSMSFEYTMFHPYFDLKKHGEECPRYYTAFQGNRIIFTKEKPLRVTIECPKQESPAWDYVIKAAQERHPTKTFDLVYPVNYA